MIDIRKYLNKKWIYNENEIDKIEKFFKNNPEIKFEKSDFWSLRNIFKTIFFIFIIILIFWILIFNKEIENIFNIEINKFLKHIEFLIIYILVFSLLIWIIIDFYYKQKETNVKSSNEKMKSFIDLFNNLSNEKIFFTETKPEKIERYWIIKHFSFYFENKISEKSYFYRKYKYKGYKSWNSIPKYKYINNFEINFKNINFNFLKDWISINKNFIDIILYFLLWLLFFISIFPLWILIFIFIFISPIYWIFSFENIYDKIWLTISLIISSSVWIYIFFKIKKCLNEKNKNDFEKKFSVYIKDKDKYIEIKNLIKENFGNDILEFNKKQNLNYIEFSNNKIVFSTKTFLPITKKENIIHNYLLLKDCYDFIEKLEKIYLQIKNYNSEKNN